ncbi:MAG: chemotaxis protein CheW [Methylococcaceae bacterium]|nr:chemotaxis protein CheW [Methylococcaceae bacterium]
MMLLLLFHLGDQRYCLHINAVERVARAVEIMPLPDMPVEILGVINVYGRIIPVLNVRKRLGLVVKELDLTDQFIIVHAANRTIALLVDGIAGVIDYPEEKAENSQAILPDFRIIEGVVKLNGETVFIEDVNRLCAVFKEGELTPSKVGDP